LIHLSIGISIGIDPSPKWSERGLGPVSGPAMGTAACDTDVTGVDQDGDFTMRKKCCLYKEKAIFNHEE